MKRLALLSLTDLSCVPAQSLLNRRRTPLSLERSSILTALSVSGVTVTATHAATGLKRETETNDEGLYVLSNLAAR